MPTHILLPFAHLTSPRYTSPLNTISYSIALALAPVSPVAVTVKVASTPVKVTKLVQPRVDSASAALKEEGDAAAGELTEAGNGTVTPSLVSVLTSGCSVVVIATPASDVVVAGSSALSVAVILTPAACGVVNGVGASSVSASVAVTDTTPPALSGPLLLLETGTGMARGEETTVVLPSA